MINQEPQINQKEQSKEGYRGVLIYRQERGHRQLTLMVDLNTIDEQSCVVSRLGEIDLVEEAEHIPACLPVIGIDVYHFEVTDGTEIELTITDQAREYQARYTVQSNGIEEHLSLLRLHVINVC